MTIEKIRYLIENDKVDLFYKSKVWQIKKHNVMIRDNNECQECKKEGKLTIKQLAKLDVHHKKELKEYPELALEDSNLVTVCVHHHNILDSKGSYGAKKKKFVNEERW